MNLITLSSVGAALLLVGCVAKTGTRALSMDHPANPQAKEVVYVPPSSVLAMEGKMELDEKTGTGSAGQHAQGSHATPIDHSQHVQPEPPAQSKAAAAQPDDHAGHGRKVIEVSHSTQKQIDSLIKAYLALTAMLAEDKVEGATDQLAVIRQAAKALSDAKEDAIKPLAEQVAKTSPQKAEDLAVARNALKTLSEPVIKLAQLAPPTKAVAPAVYQVYCPHIKASWLQPGEKIANPYFGNEMLGCGKVTQKIQPAQGHEH